MPGRVASRAPHAANARTRTRAASPTDNIPEESPSTSLRTAVCQVFTDVHKSNTGHRKLVVSLRRIQEACCYEPAKNRKQAIEEDFDEPEFNEEVARCMLRVLVVRKSEPAGDRIVKFLALFLKHATEQGQDDPILRTTSD